MMTAAPPTIKKKPTSGCVTFFTAIWRSVNPNKDRTSQKGSDSFQTKLQNLENRPRLFLTSVLLETKALDQSGCVQDSSTYLHVGACIWNWMLSSRAWRALNVTKHGTSWFKQYRTDACLIVIQMLITNAYVTLMHNVLWGLVKPHDELLTNNINRDRFRCEGVTRACALSRLAALSDGWEKKRQRGRGGNDNKVLEEIVFITINLYISWGANRQGFAAVGCLGVPGMFAASPGWLWLHRSLLSPLSSG